MCDLWCVLGVLKEEDDSWRSFSEGATFRSGISTLLRSSRRYKVLILHRFVLDLTMVEIYVFMVPFLGVNEYMLH